VEIKDQKVGLVSLALFHPLGCGRAGHHLQFGAGQEDTLQKLEKHFLVFHQESLNHQSILEEYRGKTYT
jgi:hypothetical protein